MPLVLCIWPPFIWCNTNMVFPIAVSLAQDTCWVISGTSCVIFFFFKISKKVFVGKVLVYVNTWLVVLQKINKWVLKKTLAWGSEKKRKNPITYVTKRIKRINHMIIYNAVSSFLVLSWKVWVLENLQTLETKLGSSNLKSSKTPTPKVIHKNQEPHKH